MNLDFEPTGSISQDALRLGFQTTCNKGIASLLKVDDITVEECSKFKERHEEEVQKYVKALDDSVQHVLDSEYDIKGDLGYIKYKYWGNKTWIPAWIEFPYIIRKRKQQSFIKYKYTVTSIGETDIDVQKGRLRTLISVNIVTEPWEGYTRNGYLRIPAQERKKVFEYFTNAKVCSVKYIDYDKYHERYIPDEAAALAKKAIDLGMTKIFVCIPILESSSNNQVINDPIIVGHVDKQMFLIAWFGYDKNNHMSCNV